MPTLRANGLTLAYETHGAGRPLLLISGVGYGGWFWRKIAPALAQRSRVIVFDNRGAGGSDKPDGPYTVAQLAADTAGLLDGLGIKAAHVVGHSLGGFIAQELAVSRPGLVSKLVLASTNSGGPHVIPIPPEALQVLTDRSGEPLDLIRRGLQVATAPGWAEAHPEAVQELIAYRLTNPVPPAQYAAQVAAGAGMAQLSADEVAARLAAITAPALIVFGEHDRVVPPGNAELLARQLPQARIAIVPGAGHLFPIEAPEAAVAALIEFLQ